METTLSARSPRPVAIWLLVGVGMIIIQVVLGGITRLTGSGLSITEWEVVTGSLPPLNETQWLQEFDKYRQTPQFQLLNADFDLSDFKFIFFWEWFHRLWARLIGVVFFIPFVIFLVQKRFRPAMVKPMIILFLLGGLQGAVGWIMVQSGLTGDAVFVKPTRLALHFIFAMGLLVYTWWFALQWLVPDEQRIRDTRNRVRIGWILVLLTLQLIYGALMAGNKAALAAPTWPDINGHWIPHDMLSRHGMLSFIDDPILVHFIHRGLAYALLILIALLCLRWLRPAATSFIRQARGWTLLLVLVQVALGIFTVLSSKGIVPNRWGLFEWMAQLHQVTGMLLLLSLTALLFGLSRRPN
jgi:cytochrome c oxidase assembly protein subunit 15